jgi:hypothetical protein
LAETSEGSSCVLTDSFEGDPGSSLGWNGTIINGKRAFHKHSKALFGSTYMTPCYIFQISSTTGKYELLSNVNGISIDEIDQLPSTMAWVSTGEDYFTECFDLLNEPTPLMAFNAMMDNVSDVYEASLYQTCSFILEKSASDLSNMFQSNVNLFTITLSQTQRGSFFKAASEMEFVVDSQSVLFTHRSLGTIDRQTRTFRVYALAKNNNKKRRFYSMVHATFTFDSNGKVALSFHVDNIPIVHYQYGFEDTAIEDLSVLALECTFTFVFALYFIREIFQLRYRANRIFKLIVDFLEKHDIYIQQSRITPDDNTPSVNPGLRAPSDLRVFSQGIDEAIEGNAECDTGKEGGVELAASVAEGSQNTDAAAPRDVESGLSGGKSIARKSARFNSESMQIAAEDDNGSKTPMMLSPDQNPAFDILDWATIICVLLCIIYRIQYVDLARDFHKYASDLGDKLLSYEDRFQSIIDQFAELEYAHGVYIRVTSATVFVGVCQFFRYTSFDPHLAIVVSTLYHSITALMPVLLVFLIVLVCYGVVGMAMYGSTLPEWATLSKALNSLFFFVLGEIGAYDESKCIMASFFILLQGVVT